ncbi:exodeoxyribonuclease VII large subunit [Alphaproteobacteria bacterium]|nr:exodeoxyribonuclease VII large subunit [Alphaproteobacteria bacterium]
MDEQATNVTEYSVSEISGAVKRKIEDDFSFVRVRGELGRVTRPASGHLYFDLKDDKSVLAAVCWKGVAKGLAVNPEQGLEVICSGRLTTFPGQSRYQMLVEQMEPAGEGALMALLEARRKKLATEGLFDADRKQPIPYLPEVIGVVTSPSGAVIRDILHRLADRFPRHVLVWPVRVQGQGSDVEVANAINGFNLLDGSEGSTPRPNVIIVARGGGSLEDLWSFNEEVVVRAVAASTIPVISAIGHETDTTLIDFVADQRAPTPTAAAEMAVPVRSELIAHLLDRERRLLQGQQRRLDQAQQMLIGLSRGMKRPQDLWMMNAQRLDNLSQKLSGALSNRLQLARSRFQLSDIRLSPRSFLQDIERSSARIAELQERISARSFQQNLERYSARVAELNGRISPRSVLQNISRYASHTMDLQARLLRGAGAVQQTALSSLQSLARQLDLLSHEAILERGFALVLDPAGKPLRTSEQVKLGDRIDIRLAKQNHLSAEITSQAPASKSTIADKPIAKSAPPPKRPASDRSVNKKSVDDEQGDLF